MKIDDTLTDSVVDGFRVVKATDMEMIERAITTARVTGSVGATESVESDGKTTRIAKVHRICQASS